MNFDPNTEPAPPGSMVTVARFESPVEAQIAKGALESAGVECLLAGENANNLIQSAFGVEIQVRAEDEAAARELLAPAAGSMPDESSEEG